MMMVKSYHFRFRLLYEQLLTGHSVCVCLLSPALSFSNQSGPCLPSSSSHHHHHPLIHFGTYRACVRIGIPIVSGTHTCVTAQSSHSLPSPLAAPWGRVRLRRRRAGQQQLNSPSGSCMCACFRGFDVQIGFCISQIVMMVV